MSDILIPVPTILNFNPFPNDKFQTLPNWKILQTAISNLMKMAERSPNGWKKLWEKEKLLIMSNFSFSHSVFKWLVLQTHKNQGLFWKGLITPWQRTLKNSLEKRKGNACNQHLHLLSWCFLPLSQLFAKQQTFFWSKLKAFAVNRRTLNQTLRFPLGRVENTMGKGENAGCQHFILFPLCFQKALRSLKVGIVW